MNFGENNLDTGKSPAGGAKEVKRGKKRGNPPTLKLRRLKEMVKNGESAKSQTTKHQTLLALPGRQRVQKRKKRENPPSIKLRKMKEGMITAISP